jgi:hypothetical protein
MFLLRPNAKWEISNNHFTRWEDERPCPTIEEVDETIEKIKAFEESINTIYTKKQLEEMGIRETQLEEALGDAA